MSSTTPSAANNQTDKDGNTALGPIAPAMYPNTPRGAFILLEGCDRAGKTTQSAALLAHLHENDVEAESWHFPRRSTATGVMINAYLRQENTVDIGERAMQLLFAANRWEAAAELREKLQAGVTVIADRYSFSGVAYSAAKDSPGLPASWCAGLECGLPAPDVVCLLDVNIAAAAKRANYGNEIYERREFQQRVRECFECMAAHVPATSRPPIGANYNRFTPKQQQCAVPEQPPTTPRRWHIMPAGTVAEVTALLVEIVEHTRARLAAIPDGPDAPSNANLGVLDESWWPANFTSQQ